MQHLFMLVLSLAVVGAMALTFGWFLRRLKKIQDERWAGKHEVEERP